ncbi:ribosome maturation factor RimP [Aeromicrobium sp. Leaf350]|uniref:ribosome maturation factor RimP n=1 Tax=Aeromicrobium sp. Leaf350 TaxID=2876565 RepID=UPI001E47ADBF|nr:ribosome maturation factor RimP [Aeromicrobium sp. Leaf350]
MDDRITDVVRDVVGAHGLDLDDVTLGGGQRRMLRIVVDAEGGVDLDALGPLTREISLALDEDPAAQKAVGSGAYTLEITSRGTDRPLTLPRHWQRNRGRLVAITPIDGDRFTGRIREADDDAATVTVAQVDRQVHYSEIRTAVVQVELNRKDG